MLISIAIGGCFRLIYCVGMGRCFQGALICSEDAFWHGGLSFLLARGVFNIIYSGRDFRCILMGGFDFLKGFTGRVDLSQLFPPGVVISGISG